MLICRRGCRLIAGPCHCHLSTACRACFAVAQDGRAAAEDEDAEDDEERGLAKEEEVNMEEVEVKVMAEADMLVWIGARQRGRRSTLLD